MSENIKQVFDANPSTTLPTTALIYTGLSPFGPTNDSAITAQNLYARPLPIGSLSPSTASFTALQTLTTAANALLIQAYDVDGVAYKVFGTLTANNTPSLAFVQPAGATLTWDGGAIGLSQAAAANFTDVQALRIGNVSPGTGIFSSLRFPVNSVLTSTNTVVSTLSTLFEIDTAGVNITALDYTTYQTNFQFWIKNASTGDNTFTPDAGDNIEGQSILTIPAGNCVQIAKSLTANTWKIISNYNNDTAPSNIVSVTTADATPTIIFSVPITQGQQITITGAFNSIYADASNAAGGYLKYAAFRPTSGDATQITAPEYWEAASFGVAPIFYGAVNTGTQTIDIFVKGVAATSIKWQFTYNYSILNA